MPKLDLQFGSFGHTIAEGSSPYEDGLEVPCFFQPPSTLPPTSPIRALPTPPKLGEFPTLPWNTEMRLMIPATAEVIVLMGNAVDEPRDEL